MSVLLLKQHWLVDVAAGWALAMVGVAAFRAHLAAASYFRAVPVPARQPARRENARAEPMNTRE